MINLDDALRDSLEDLADQGRPVNLGCRTLARVRRRRRNTALGTAAALAVLAVLIPVGLVRLTHDAPPVAASVGRSVVAAYRDRDQVSYTLDPLTGEYHRLRYNVDAISPDLRHALSMTVSSDGHSSETKINVWPTTSDGPVHSIKVPGSLQIPVWSPDGARLAFWTAPEGSGSWDGIAYPPFRSVVVVDLASGRYRQIDLGLRPDEHAFFLSWGSPGRLLLVASDSNPFEQADLALVDADGSGKLDRLRIPSQGERAWVPTGLVRGGRALLERVTPSGQLELAQLDPTAGTLIGDQTRVTTRPATTGGAAAGYAVSWPANEQVLLSGALANPHGGLTRPEATTHPQLTSGASAYLTDLRTGTPKPVRLRLPANTSDCIVVDAGGLDPAAAHLAF